MSGSGVGRVVRRKDRSRTPAALPAPRKALQLTWEKKHLAVAESETTQLILRPKTTLKKYLPFAETNWDDSTSVTLAEFFDAYQEEMRRYVNEQVAASSGTIAMVQNQARVENVILENAVHNLDFNLSKMQAQIQHLLLERDQLLQPTDPMDLDLPEPQLPDYIYYIQEAIAKGQIVIVPPVQDKKPRVRADSAFTEELFPLPIRPPPPPQQQQITEPPADPVTLGWSPRGIQVAGPSSTPLPPRRALQPLFTSGGGYLGTDTPTGIGGGLFGTHIQRPPPPPPPPVQEPLAPPPPPPPPPGGDDNRGRQPEGDGGNGDQGGGGGGRGGGRVAGGGGGDPGSSDSDSEPEGGDPRAWKRYYRRQMRKQEDRMMRNMAALINGASSSTSAGRARDPKAPQPSKFKGEAHDVDRFLRQCENVFILEASSFQNDGTKIRYTGNLLEGQIVVNWYEAYHNLIDQGSANRAAGQQVQLDPHWTSWETFTHSFRSSFGDRVTREEAVAKWNKLTQTAGIDAFLDKIVQLMWKTGYSGEVVDDKISQGLNAELALDWAKVAVKPDTLHERIQLIRHMGHVLERHSKMKAPPVRAETEKKGGEKKSTKRKGQKAPADTEKKEAGSNQTSSEKKDKAVELKGMSEYILPY
jgi:uncharacterized membrane protein YgcG